MKSAQLHFVLSARASYRENEEVGRGMHMLRAIRVVKSFKRSVSDLFDRLFMGMTEIQSLSSHRDLVMETLFPDGDSA